MGQPGRSVYICPQDEQEDILFLGIAADEIPAGVFEKDTLSLSLTKVEGPGAVSLYSSDAFGNPTLFFDSSDGLGENDVFPMSVGGHAHQNWAFTEPGYYQISLQASATLANGTPITSDEATFSLRCLPQPFRQKGSWISKWPLRVTNLSWLPWMKPTSERSFPSELVLMASDQAQQIIPEDTSYSFLGAAGDTVYVLPQEEQEGILYLGIAGDEIESGVFKQEAVSLHLVGVRGPGNVSLYATDAFGAPQVFFNSGDGIDEQDVFPVAVGGHAHQNWAFTAPGVYKVDVQASRHLGRS